MVEDSDSDIRLAMIALKKAKFINNIHVVRNGADALDFLKRRGKYENVVRPDIVLLDIHLPILNGREVLVAIRSDEGLKDLPVAMLTMSGSVDDIFDYKELDVNCFISKPLNLDKLLYAVSLFDQFGIQVVRT